MTTPPNVASSNGRLTDEQKRRLAGRGRTFHERLETKTTNASDPGGDVEKIIDDWRERIGEDEWFEGRLDHLGLTREECRRRLREREWPADGPVPEWVERIDDLLAFVAASSIDEIDCADEEGASIPFTELVVAITEYARCRLDLDDAAAYLDESALEDLRWLLRERVAGHVAQPLFIDFKTYVAERDRTLALADDPPTPESPRRYYDGFVSLLFDGGFDSFLLEYSFLARILDTVIEQWIVFVEEFLERLATDHERLSRSFGDGEPIGTVTGIDVGGDRHANGRATLTLEFSSGTRAVYKPRCVDVSVAFFEFVSWINERFDGLDLRTVSFVVGDGYGWMEWVDHEACSSEAAIERYYRRTGQLIAVLYALRFHDGHFENVIANGEYPVMVDLETLARPAPPSTWGENKVGNRYRRETVLETDMLPEVDTATGPGESPIEDEIPDLSGLGSGEVTWGGLQIPEFTDVNTDLMELDFRGEHTMEAKNLPLLGNDAVGPDGYESTILDGFESTYRFFLERKTPLLEDDGPLEAFDDQEVRFLIAPTFWYGRLLTSLQVPSYLRTGIEFGCRLELLAKRVFTDGEAEVTRELYDAEREALYRLDIPRFSTRLDSVELLESDVPVDDSYFVEPPVAPLRDRIEGFDEADLGRQRSYLELAFYGGLVTQRPETKVWSADVSSLEPIDRARGMFYRLLEESVLDADDERSWLVERGTPDGFNAQLLSENLYEGRIGVALFGAGLFDTVGEERYRRFAEDVLAPVLESATQDDPFADLGLGAAGHGGIVYGLTTLGHLLREDSYVDAARDVALGLDPEHLRTDEAHDVIVGNAGALLALLRLYDATGDEDVLERARIAGEQLLSARVDSSGTPVWITTRHQQALQGFSHGVAGIAYALGRLSEATDSTRFADAALESLAFERELYDETAHNWRDLRGYYPAEHTRSWCYGRPGIGLSRLGLSSAVDDDGVCRDLDRALLAPEPEVIDARDHLCCGNFGRVEWLVEAGKVLEDDTYHDHARRLAAGTLEHADASGGFRSSMMNEHVYSPGFFTGEPGIGYALLRLENPELPCVLYFK